LWQAVAVTLAGHAAVLGYLGTRPPQPAPQGTAQPFAFTVQVRPAPEPPAREERSAPVAVAPAPASPQPVAEQAAAVERQAAPAPPPEPPYLPRGELTVAPKLLGTADVPFPEDVAGIVHLAVRITLFIDEQGSVQRIRIDTPDVHPAFERAIRQAFAAARFSPGELHQVPVRSQMRLEVDFEAPERTPPIAGSRPPRS
jgi:TonB family protein